MTLTRLLATAGLTLGLLIPAYPQAGGLDGLYFRMMMAFGNVNQEHWWFLPGGRFMNAVPDGGLDAAMFEATCQKKPEVCGTYQVQGAKLQLIPRKGSPRSLGFKQLPEGNIELDGLFTKHVDQFGKDATLDGHYSWSGGASGGGTAVSASKGFDFHTDGTFSTNSTAGNSIGTKYAARSEGAGAGTYKLNGNILDLTDNGKTTRHTAYPYKLSESDVRLNIDGEMYKRNR
jgi:hypothetical protein